MAEENAIGGREGDRAIQRERLCVISHASTRTRVTAVLVISRAGTLGRYHRRAQRLFRSTTGAKRGTIDWLAQTLEHQRADALFGFVHGCALQSKNFRRIERRVFFAKTQSAARDDANAAPLAIANFKNFLHDILRSAIAAGAERARVLVLEF